MDNHGSRPEVVEALRQGIGVSRRHSDTVDKDMLYVAIPLDEDGAQGTIRAAMPLAEVDEAIADLRLNLFVAGLLGLAMVIFVGGLLSHLLTRRLRDLMRHARAISRHESPARTAKEDDIQDLAGSFDSLAGQLQGQVDLLARERDRSDAILQCMSEALFALDGQGRVSLVNRAAEALFGFDRPPLGRPLQDVIGDRQLGELVQRVTPDRPASVEFTFQSHEPKQLLAMAAAQRSGQGAVIVIHDITEIRRMERLNRDFVANASHELRTPVAIIRANAETLLDGACHDGPMARKLLLALDKSALRLSSILSDLLDLARLDGGQYQISLRPVTLRGLVTNVLETLQPVADRKQLALTSHVSDTTRVLADARALEQMLSNLVDNAIKYTPAGGRVWVTETQTSERIRVRVHDDGPGVPAEHRASLFERFYRVDKGRSRNMGGTGLGLSIVKQLAEAMDGRVGMDEGEPRGSVFWVELVGA
jgi:two-component system phosphate regulon sensor histidine kinase PhoR